MFGQKHKEVYYTCHKALRFILDAGGLICCIHNTLKGAYLSGLGIDVGHSVFPPMLIEGLLLLTLQGLRVVILINAVLQKWLQVRITEKEEQSGQCIQLQYQGYSKGHENTDKEEETYALACVQIQCVRTDFEILSGVRSPALLSLLCAVDGLDSVQHQILQLQCLHQVCVPHNA